MSDGTPLFRRVCRRWATPGLLAAGLVVAVSACGDSAAVVGPGGGTNTPPTIQSLVAGAPQVDGEQSVQLTATVTDTETVPAQLTYIWSAAPSNGTFTGTGSQVRWKPPATAPDVFTISLTVVETYVSGSTTKENRVVSTVQVRYNDAIIGGLVGQFLTDFGTFAVPPQQCVRNFSDFCAGKAEELSQIISQRAAVRIQSATYSIASITLKPSGTSADIVAPCQFKDVRNSDGRRQTVTGTCLLGAVYENSRWLLCYSNYDPISLVVEGTGGRTTAVDTREAPFSHP